MKFRTYTLSSGRIIYAGRNAENNDILVKSAKGADTLLHTKNPGSPFVNCGKKTSKDELKQAAIFCAKYSQAWRDNKIDVRVDVFKRSDMKKDKDRKMGTWSVRKSGSIVVKKEEIFEFEGHLEKNSVKENFGEKKRKYAEDK